MYLKMWVGVVGDKLLLPTISFVVDFLVVNNNLDSINVLINFGKLFRYFNL